jgi:hypothetical protein
MNGLTSGPELEIPPSLDPRNLLAPSKREKCAGADQQWKDVIAGMSDNEDY